MKGYKILFVTILVIIAVFLLLKLNKRNNLLPLSPIPQTENTASKKSTGPAPDFPFKLPAGFTIHLFASGLFSPRDLVFSPGGTLLVSSPSLNQVIALPDPDNQGTAREQKTVINSGKHLHGLAFYQNWLFVAHVNQVVRYTWDEEKLEAVFDKVLFSLPANNNHNNRTITIDTKGIMYVSVGSTCNVCLESSPLSATIVVSDFEGNNPHVFASGLRNAAFSALNPETNKLWATGMGRDFLGDNLPPDEINIIEEGLNYGWPFCYGNKVLDKSFDATKADFCQTTTAPIFEIPAHSAPLGLVFINSSQFPADWQNDLLVSYHGSWNRTVPTGYKVVRLKVDGNSITGVQDFLTGFLENGTVFGRPVDLIFDTQGNLYISDDKAGNIYLVEKSGK